MAFDIPIMKTGKLDGANENDAASAAFSKEAHSMAMDSTTKNWTHPGLMHLVADKDEDEYPDLVDLTERHERGEILPVDPIDPPPLGTFPEAKWHLPFDR
jgi:hypothetical protein